VPDARFPCQVPVRDPRDVRLLGSYRLDAEVACPDKIVEPACHDRISHAVDDDRGLEVRSRRHRAVSSPADGGDESIRILFAPHDGHKRR
jgi:hypothetical protein